MAADYTYDYFLAIDNSGDPVKAADFTLYAAASGGSPAAMYDMNGSPIGHVTSNSNGVCPRFRADIATGYLDNGTIRLPIASTAVMNSLTAATAAQTAAQTAQSAATNAQSSAAQAATNAANSASVAQAQPGLVTILQNSDGTWPDRRTATTDRNKIVAWIITVSPDSTPGTAPIVTSGAGLALPTPVDLFGWANPPA